MDQKSTLSKDEVEDVKALVVSENQELAPNTPITELQSQLEYETQKRDLLENFIGDHLVRGIDYGSISATTKSGKQFKTKPMLFKPGADKVMSLFRWIASFEIDNETRDLFNNKEGLIVYICRIYNTQGMLVASGRGACDSEQEGKDPNNAIKMAQKRAKLDAIMSTGWLSDFFTREDDDPRDTQENKTSQVYSGNNKCSECGASGRYHSPRCSQRE